MESLVELIQQAKRKKLLFGYTNLFVQKKKFSDESISELETTLQTSIPTKARKLLYHLGYGQINDIQFHGSDWVYAFDEDNGAIEGFVTFASDDMGNYYAFNPNNSNPELIYYCSHDLLGYCELAKDAEEFLRIFVDSNFNITKYVAELELSEL